MSTCDILLKQIIAEPDDLTLRLVYADALDEQGGEENEIRAELIRLGCDLYVTDPEFRLDWAMNNKVYECSADARIRRTCELVRSLDLLTYRTDKAYSFHQSYGSIWQKGMVVEWTGDVRGWSNFAYYLLATNPVETVRFVRWYWADVIDAQVSFDRPWNMYRLSCRWAIPNRPAIQYQYSVAADHYRVTPRVMEEFTHECRARTEGVFRTWYPSVREWKGIPDD